MIANIRTTAKSVFNSPSSGLEKQLTNPISQGTSLLKSGDRWDRAKFFGATREFLEQKVLHAFLLLYTNFIAVIHKD
jgi:hypothetical protein